MHSSSSSEHISHQPNVSWVTVSPVSATQALSTNLQSLPLMVPGQAFEMWTFNVDETPVAHGEPVLTSRHSLLPTMQSFFVRIGKNDREFLQQLPAGAKQQKKLGIYLDQCDPETGCTPLTAALTRGHLDLAVDLMSLGASPTTKDLFGRMPEAVPVADGMAAMVMHFMVLHEGQDGPRSTAPTADQTLRKLLTKIDVVTGHTLLTWAISRRHDHLVGLLIDSGADFRVANRFGRTALEEACSSGSTATVSRLLESWAELGLEKTLEHLVSAMLCAVTADRPMVLAQLMSFFRDEFRIQRLNLTEDADDNPLDPVSSNALVEKAAFATFLGSPQSSIASLATLMDRTTDHFMLTEEESSLLRLNEIVAIAKQKQQQKIIEIIHAHAKLPKAS